jgi:hypothetical protein
MAVERIETAFAMTAVERFTTTIPTNGPPVSVVTIPTNGPPVSVVTIPTNGPPVSVVTGGYGPSGRSRSGSRERGRPRRRDSSVSTGSDHSTSRERTPPRRHGRRHSRGRRAGADDRPDRGDKGVDSRRRLHVSGRRRSHTVSYVARPQRQPFLAERKPFFRDRRRKKGRRPAHRCADEASSSSPRRDSGSRRRGLVSLSPAPTGQVSVRQQVQPPLGQGLGAKAFFKMYGDKTKGHKYCIAKNADGGMEYVKKMLDVGGESAHLIVLMMKNHN